MSDFIVGLTGGIGSGKSAVGKMFTELGIEVIDADQVARDVVAPGSPALAKIAERFGADVIDHTGALDRATLRDIVFSNDEHKNWLNALLHPLIRSQMIAQCHAAQSQYAVLEVPLLVEGELHKQMDFTVVVDVPESTQLARASARDDADESQIRAIMKAQASRQQRCAVADTIIDNNGELSQTQEQVASLHQHLLAKLSTAKPE